MPSARSVDSLSLAEARTLVLQDAELRQSLVDIARPQAGGASKGGQYNKHDTARLRFIRDTALKGLRLGMLVPEEDFRMIRLPPMQELEKLGSAVDKAAMAAWAERHGKRGGSKKSTLDEHEQQTATLEPPPRPDKAELFNKWQIEIRQEAQEEAARKTPK